MDAAIFDLEGVLISTGRCRVTAWQELCGRKGWRFTRLGATERATLDQIAADNNRDISGEERNNLLDELADELAAQVPTLSTDDLIGEAVGFALELGSYGCTTAIVTLLPAGGEAIRALGLSELVDVAISGGALEPGAAYGAVLTEAVQRLTTAPERTLYFSEKAEAIDTARDTGLFTIAYGSSRELGSAHRQISSFSELDITELLASQVLT